VALRTKGWGEYADEKLHNKELHTMYAFQIVLRVIELKTVPCTQGTEETFIQNFSRTTYSYREKASCVTLTNIRIILIWMIIKLTRVRVWSRFNCGYF
jgi:hypothetical protein